MPAQERKEETMFDAPIFEGSAEEFIARQEEFAGRSISVFATPNEDEAIDIPTPRTTIRSREHLEELLLEAQNSPLETMPDDYAEFVMEEVRKLRAEGKTPACPAVRRKEV